MINLDGFVFYNLFQTVACWLVLYDIYCAATAVSMYARGVRNTLVFKVNYFDSCICDFRNCLGFRKYTWTLKEQAIVM